MKRLLKRSRDNPSSEDPPSVAENKTKEYKIGDIYDPKLLPDYGGPLFRHVHSRLVQHDITDLDHRVIPPWEEYEALKEGTLVIATVSLHTFIMAIKDLNGKPTGEERKVIFFSNSIYRYLQSRLRFIN